MTRTCIVSECQKYRYMLSDTVGRGCGRLLWIMLNPSTADATTNDPTIRRVIDFTERWGYREWAVCNLYAYRATDPSELKRLTPAERFGPQNAFWLHSEIGIASSIVVAWGGKRIDPVPSLTYDAAVHCLGLTKSGEPLHPLYLRKSTLPIRWHVRGATPDAP